jgi:hypothetical protein
MKQLKGIDDAVAQAIHGFVVDHGSGWITAAELLSDHPEIDAHCSQVSFSLKRLREHNVIPQYNIAVRECSRQLCEDRVVKNMFYVTLI